MHTRIAKLNCRYRVFGAPADGLAQADRMDGMLRREVADALDESLQQVYEADPKVYVLRRVDSSLLLKDPVQDDDVRLGHRIGEHLARAVTHTIAHARPGSEVMTYADEADHLACFLRDLADGHAWGRWQYGAFQRWHDGLPGDIVRNLFLESPHLIAGTLRRLHELGSVEEVVGLMDADDLRTLWDRGLGARAPTHVSALRPFLEAAVSMLRKLGWINMSYNADGSLLQRLARGLHAIPDWRNATSLAATVLDAILIVLDDDRAGTVNRGRQSPASRRTIMKTDLAHRSWEWMDLDWLVDRLNRIEDTSQTMSDVSTLPRRRRDSTLTPRHVELLRDLAAALEHEKIAIRFEDAADAGTKLRWYIALVAYAPTWADSPFAVALVDRLSASLVDLSSLPFRDAMIERLSSGGLSEALRLIDARRREALVTSCVFLAEVLGVVPELARGLAGDVRSGRPRPRDSASPDQGRHLETHSESRADDDDAVIRFGVARSIGAAGIFLLLRAVMDMRLPALAAEGEFPRVDSRSRLACLLASLGVSWAGLESRDDLDPGVRAFAGPACPLNLTRLTDAWRETTTPDAEAFQSTLVCALQRLRFINAEHLHVHEVMLSDNVRGLVLGDATGRLWLRGHAAYREFDRRAVIESWLEDWRDVIGGETPTLVVSESLHAALPRTIGAQAIVLTDAEADSPDVACRVYVDGRADLTTALKSLGSLSGVEPSFDLTLKLTGCALLRVWARWLKRFADASVPYLLEQFVRRDGSLRIDEKAMIVALSPRPLDMVLEMSGYLDDLEMITWLDGRQLRFET